MSRCLGGRPAHAALMKYELDFLRSYAPLPRFSWSVYLEGHEPSFRARANLDADLAAHLLRLRHLHGERTAILLVSCTFSYHRQNADDTAPCIIRLMIFVIAFCLRSSSPRSSRASSTRSTHLSHASAVPR